MLLGRVDITLILKERERADEFGSRVGRLDHFVYKAALGRNVRVGELLLKLLYARAPRGLAIFRLT